MQNIDFLSETEALGVYPFEIAHNTNTHITDVEAMLLGKLAVSESVAKYIQSVRSFFDKQMLEALEHYQKSDQADGEAYLISTYLTYNEFKKSESINKFPNERSHRIWSIQLRQKINELGGNAKLLAA